MAKVKFLKTFAQNKVGSITEFDKELCDKLIKRGVAVAPSKSDLAEAKKVADAREKEALAHIKADKEQKAELKKLHKPISIIANRKAIKLAREEAKKKAKKKK